MEWNGMNNMNMKQQTNKRKQKTKKTATISHRMDDKHSSNHRHAAVNLESTTFFF